MQSASGTKQMERRDRENQPCPTRHIKIDEGCRSRESCASKHSRIGGKTLGVCVNDQADEW
ncbi:hypothetical protein JI435_408310 [Parastagonospora nodorum SN15]|uniref:Uncharacterized protein n=2 Tax=Phaeosphaeria nodorum (strain SN15 / ATCC MYA-4574 / FGSC 10173) TaxID=321614 RepID=A0A7U2I1N2_PHANO|nr:hypothetical protein JI435_408310 [Parastagonospora nodorum SN15]